MGLVFDALIIGAGHAGIEAARALAAMGSRVALLTMDDKKIGAMSCNPAIGGVAKSHLVTEIDALGGLMGFVADSAAIQSRRLNMNKGPAVRSTRLQCDKDRYVRTMISEIARFPVQVICGEAVKIEKINNDWEVRLADDQVVRARALLITTGTFMRGLMFCGFEKSQGGRIGDAPANFLSKYLSELGHNMTRLKTGTPARLDAKSINFDALEKQWGDPELRRFSWRVPKEKLPQLCCYLTYTNERTHDIIRANFHKSPLFSGEIVGTGPRYCPSIEDKIKRFSERPRHQIFLEPEGLDTLSIYPNGMSTSLPADVQLEFLQSIAGLEKVSLLKPGYAVEYDTISPTDLKPSLMSKFQEGLFFAGQVNRTSGYEEAAAQGLWAGINAALFLKNQETLIPLRGRSYIETLVDDLTDKGTEEPYRMFTSRSEYRLLLREDNAQERLFDLAKSLGLLSQEQLFAYEDHLRDIEEGKKYLSTHRMRVSADRVISFEEYLKRPEVTWDSIVENLSISERAIERLEVEAKYSGYLQRQVLELKSLEALYLCKLNESFDISSIKSLSAEVIEKYKRHKPRSVYELSKISGIPPTAVITIAKKASRSEKVSDDSFT
jgi:tRNA uridine 5-carboxymethylaminomethyl modification enzyme